MLRDGVFGPVAAPELASSIVTRFAEDRTGDVWLTSWQGLFRYDHRTHTVHGPIGGAAAMRPVFVDSAGKIWVADERNLLECDDGKLHKRHNVVNGIWDITDARGGGLWLATELGVRRYGRGERLTALPNTPQAPCRALLEDEHGQLWVGSVDGLFVTSGDESQRQSPERVLTKEQVGKEVRALMRDHEGNLWVGTDGAGLYRVQSPRVTALRFGTPTLKALLPDGENGVFISFGCNGLFHIDAAGTLDLSSPVISVRCSDDLLAAPDGALWVPDWRYIVRWDGSQLQRFSVEHEPRSLAWDVRGGLLIGGPAGLQRLRDGDLSTLVPAARLGGTQGVVKVVQTSDEAVWFGVAGGGLARWEHDRLTLFDQTHGLQKGEVRAIYEDPEGVLWIGTYGGGLSRLLDGKFTQITTRNGLHDDAVSCIIPDQRGHLWINSNRGAFRIEMDALRRCADGTLDSIHCITVDSGEGNGSSGCRTRDGRIWFPTLDGVAIIDAEGFRVNDSPPEVVVERLTVSGREVPIVDRIELEPGSRDMELHFAALSYTHPQIVRFKYRLHGYDNDWIDAGTRRSAVYTNIPPGAYEFRVIASNNDGIWNQVGASLALRLQPYFYQTRWFGAAVAALIALGLLGLHALRTRSIRAAKRVLEKAVAKRTAELRSSEECYRDLAVELEQRVLERTSELDESNEALRNEVVVRAHAEEELQRQREQLRALASQSILAEERERRRLATGLHDSIMQDLALAKLKLQCMEGQGDAPQAAEVETVIQTLDKSIRESRSLVFELSPPVIYEFGLEAAVEWLARRNSKQSGVPHYLHTEQALEPLPQDTQVLLFQVVRELLTNVHKHARASRVDIVLRQHVETVEIEVRDDGVGFEPRSVRPRRGFASGFGLFSVHERISQLGGDVHIESARGQGTQVSITVPSDHAESGAEAGTAASGRDVDDPDVDIR